MLNLFILLSLYVTGAITTWLSLIIFGNYFTNIDYDNQVKTYANYGDWDTNAEAYFWWSLGWFISLPIVFLFSIYGLLIKKSNKIINVSIEKNKKRIKKETETITLKYKTK